MSKENLPNVEVTDNEVRLTVVKKYSTPEERNEAVENLLELRSLMVKPEAEKSRQDQSSAN